MQCAEVGKSNSPSPKIPDSFYGLSPADRPMLARICCLVNEQRAWRPGAWMEANPSRIPWYVEKSRKLKAKCGPVDLQLVGQWPNQRGAKVRIEAAYIKEVTDAVRAETGANSVVFYSIYTDMVKKTSGARSLWRWGRGCYRSRKKVDGGASTVMKLSTWAGDGETPGAVQACRWTVSALRSQSTGRANRRGNRAQPTDTWSQITAGEWKRGAWGLGEQRTRDPSKSVMFGEDPASVGNFVNQKVFSWSSLMGWSILIAYHEPRVKTVGGIAPPLTQPIIPTDSNSSGV